MITPPIFVDTPKLQADVSRASQALGTDVVRINFQPGMDWMGFASIFFNIVLSNQASSPARLRQVTQRVALTLMNELRTDEQGVRAYFNYRSESEVAQMNDPAWVATP